MAGNPVVRSGRRSSDREVDGDWFPHIGIQVHGIDEIFVWKFRRSGGDTFADALKAGAETLTAMTGDENHAAVRSQVGKAGLEFLAQREIVLIFSVMVNKASMTVLPVTTMALAGTPSPRRLALEVSVGAKWICAKAPVNLRLASSGQGSRYHLYAGQPLHDRRESSGNTQPMMQPGSLRCRRVPARSQVEIAARRLACQIEFPP